MKNSWHRIVYEGQPIYLHKYSADWFVPNISADKLLENEAPSVDHRMFLSRLSAPNPEHYLPKIKKSHMLNEFWIHLTNRCNLTCHHCLFSSSPVEKETLSLETILPLIEEAYALGTRLFVLSGGEPLVYPKIVSLLEYLFALSDTEVVILTNGILLEKLFTCKDFPKKRLHFQISLDGLPYQHDALRGQGNFDKLENNLKWLVSEGYTFSLSLCLHPINIGSLDELLDEVKRLGASHLHFLWYFSRGRGKKETILSQEKLFEALVKAYEKAEQLGLVIDNFESLKTQIFAPKGTVHDGSSAGRSSIALGYDGKFYPSAAMVGEPSLVMHGESISSALKSDVASRIAQTSIVHLHSPFRFLLGGGDFDHSFSHARSFMGDDPYESTMERLALWLISKEARRFERQQEPGLLLEMGDILYSCGAQEGVAHTHTNCLIATGESASLRMVKNYYHEAALEDKEDILNPACYEEQYIAHIPKHLRFRGYGCGSPIIEAKLVGGESMLDLGSGRGIECFIASKLVGKTGRVVGIDMLDSMLGIAREGAKEVSQNLGYNNLSFIKGYLESLPEADKCFDVITSNCVLNLSTHKRKLFAEIYRVLKEGGRLVVSDVVCDEEASSVIRNDAKLSGECIAGALTQVHLLGLLHESGFENVKLLKRFFYRNVKGHNFYSLTFVAYKPKSEKSVMVMYKGVGQYLVVDEKRLLVKGVKTSISASLAKELESELFIFDEAGSVLNQKGKGCACAIPPEKTPKAQTLFSIAPKKSISTTFSMKKMHNCMVCETPLVYANETHEKACHYCGVKTTTSVLCQNGHYVCDACHSKEALAVIEHICSHSTEKDMLSLFKHIREHPSIPKHGPEHHAMVPAIIVTCYKNSGGAVNANALKTALSRGASIIGGACGFLGICGAASGVGIGFAVLFESSPITTASRSKAQKVTHAVLGEIAQYEAARCCHREVWTALSIASKLSETFLHVKLEAKSDVKCDQKKFNQYCYGKLCPIF